MRGTRRFRRVFSRMGVSALLAGSILVAAGSGARADALACGTDVTMSTTLTDDVLCPAGWTGDGLRVTAPGITLDLGGFDVIGPGAAGVRVLAAGVTVTNGGSSEAIVSGFSAGVVFDQASGGTVRWLTMSGNGRGVLLAGGGGHTVAGNVVTGNVGDGINAGVSNSNTIDGNTISKNAAGIALDRSDGNTIDGNTVSKNSHFGVAVFCDADLNTISDNSVVNTSAGQGIIVRSGSDDTLVTGNGANLNAGDGILVEVGGGCSPASDDVIPARTRIVGNAANRNGGDGIDDATSDSLIADNTANLDGGWGILAPSACDGGGNTTRNDTLGGSSFSAC